MLRRRIRRNLEARVFHTSRHPGHGIARLASGYFYVIVEVVPGRPLPMELEESERLYSTEDKAQRRGDRRVAELIC